jgi:hypothetical protein
LGCGVMQKMSSTPCWVESLLLCVSCMAEVDRPAITLGNEDDQRLHATVVDSGASGKSVEHSSCHRTLATRAVLGSALGALAPFVEDEHTASDDGADVLPSVPRRFHHAKSRAVMTPSAMRRISIGPSTGGAASGLSTSLDALIVTTWAQAARPPASNSGNSSRGRTFG